MARLSGSIPDSGQLNNAERYLAEGKLSNISISYDHISDGISDDIRT